MTDRLPESPRFTHEMGEISGFGGGYEECCRHTLLEGLKFWDDQGEGFNPRYQVPRAKTQGGEEIEFYGVLMDQNEDARLLDQALNDAAESHGGLTGAMHQAIVNHLFFIRQNGWDRYVEEMSRDDRDDEGDPGAEND